MHQLKEDFLGLWMKELRIVLSKYARIKVVSIFNYRNVIKNHPRQEASKPLIKLASVVSTLPHWKWNNLNNVSLKSMLFSI